MQTFRNKISDKSQELVFISDVMNGDAPIWDKIDDFGFDFTDIEEIEEIKYNKNGQAFLF